MGEYINLSDVCTKITKGTTPTQADGAFSQSGINYIKSESLSYDGAIDKSKFAFITTKVHEKLKRSQIKKNDILYSIAGVNLGKCGMAEECHLPANTNQAVAIIRVDNSKANPSFIAYCLRNKSFVQQVLGGVAQSAQPNVNLGDIGRFQVPLLSIHEQNAIANLLSSLDDKIELNRRTNETLEAMAQALFRDWFVDFGPVRRKIEGASDPIQILGGLVQNPDEAARIAALFPDSLTDTGLPEGWAASTLQPYAELNPESWTARNHPDVVEYVDLSNTKWGVIESTSNLSWADAPSRARRVVRPFDTIVATTRPGNGSYAYIAKDGMTASTGFAVLRPKQEFSINAVNIAATLPENIERLATLADAHGGAYPAVKPEVVLASPFVSCGNQLLTEFEKIANSIRNRLEFGKQDNQTLAQTRDYLLPKLMSGKIRAGDVEVKAA